MEVWKIAKEDYSDTQMIDEKQVKITLRAEELKVVVMDDVGLVPEAPADRALQKLGLYRFTVRKAIGTV